MALPVVSRSGDPGSRDLGPRALATWDPFRELDELADRVNSLWASGFGGGLERWSPLADVEEHERAGILHRRTRRVGRFLYAVTLPSEVDPDGVEASLRDGVLTLRVPKSAESKPRRIAVSR